MSGESSFIEAVEKVVKDNIPVFITEGTVTKVDAETVTCDVDRGDLPELFKVRLNAVLEPGETGVTVFPKVGSKVLCAIVDNNPNDAYILEATEVENIVIHGGANGGLTITPELVTQLGKLSARVDTVFDAIKNGVPIAQDGGVGYQQTMVAILDDNTEVEDFSNIENDKITH